MEVAEAVGCGSEAIELSGQSAHRARALELQRLAGAAEAFARQGRGSQAVQRRPADLEALGPGAVGRLPTRRPSRRSHGLRNS